MSAPAYAGVRTGGLRTKTRRCSSVRTAASRSGHRSCRPTHTQGARRWPTGATCSGCCRPAGSPPAWVCRWSSTGSGTARVSGQDPTLRHHGGAEVSAAMTNRAAPSRAAATETASTATPAETSSPRPFKRLQYAEARPRRPGPTSRRQRLVGGHGSPQVAGAGAAHLSHQPQTTASGPNAADGSDTPSLRPGVRCPHPRGACTVITVNPTAPARPLVRGQSSAVPADNFAAGGHLDVEVRVVGVRARATSSARDPRHWSRDDIGSPLPGH